jgi:hypothetical protein
VQCESTRHATHGARQRAAVRSIDQHVHVIALHGNIASRSIFARRCFAQAFLNLSIHIAPTQILDIGLHLRLAC